MFANFMNKNDGDGDVTSDSGAQESGAWGACIRSLDNQICYNCKKEGNLKPYFLKLKEKRAAEEAESAAIGGAVKEDGGKGATDKHSHTIPVDAFENFYAGDKDHFFFSHLVKKFKTFLTSFLLLDSELSIKIISHQAMVTNICSSSNPITLN